ncbi:MAG: hypothetical protein H6718_08920 [Polyangiaceae bacterium]|nr:hypothetical protein [Polyangiaceae bacterium]MCB9606477.1 hypothetical protein [Polyangiaceae bacterium]
MSQEPAPSRTAALGGLRPRPLWGSLGCGAALLLAFGAVASATPATAPADSSATPLAETQADGPETDTGAGPTCIISGTAAPPKELEIYDKASGGSVVARLTGVDTPLKAFEFPKGSDARARLDTGTGKGHFRIEGYVHTKRLPIYTKKALTVTQGHLWIGAHREVHFDGSSPKRIRVAKRMTTPLAQTFKTWTSCTNLSFDQGTPTGWSIDGDARGYSMKTDSITLYDDYGRDKTEVITLNRAAGQEMLFWSTKRHGGYVQVAYQGEIMLEAWAKASALKALPKGEVMDQYIPPKRQVSGSRVQVQGETKLVKTTREHYIRLEAKEDAAKIGRIEIDTEVLVLDVVAGWASVMPKDATVMPPKDGQFWVNAEDLGIKPPPSKPAPAPAPAG